MQVRLLLVVTFVQPSASHSCLRSGQHVASDACEKCHAAAVFQQPER